jgi:UDP-glucose 4-epimerase
MNVSKLALVTGGAGFIGSHTVDLLLDLDYRVRVLDDLSNGKLENLSHNKNNEHLVFEQGNILDLTESSRIMEGVDYVFHFAGLGDIVPSIVHPEQYFTVNALGTLKVLQCAKSFHVKKFVYAASSSCYGLAEVPTTESNPIDTRYPYALSKFQGEQIALHWKKVYGLPVATIRIFNAYGPRSKTSGAYGAVFGVFLAQKLAGKPFTIVGDGSQSRDFLYVTDVARAFVAAAEKETSYEYYNLGSGAPKTIKYLVELLGGDSVNIPDRPGEPKCTWADIGRISTDLGWTPEVSFEIGVRNVLDNIDYWKDAPVWTVNSINEATSEWFKYLA